MLDKKRLHCWLSSICRPFHADIPAAIPMASAAAVFLKPGWYGPPPPAAATPGRHVVVLLLLLGL
jgi:hypothetical protein